MPAWMKSLKIACLISGTMGLVSTGDLANAGPPYNVDDPGTTEKRHQGLLVAVQSTQAAGSDSQQLPNLYYTYGLTNNLELDLSTGLVSARGGGLPRAIGVGDVAPGFRWRFQEETKHHPQLLFGYAIKFPTADATRGLGTGRTDHSLWFCGAKSCRRWTAFSNLGANFFGAGHNDLFYGAAVTNQVTEKLTLGIQWYGNTPAAPGIAPESAWGVGATYILSGDKQLMFACGRSMKGLADLNVYCACQLTWK